MTKFTGFYYPEEAVGAAQGTMDQIHEVATFSNVSTLRYLDLPTLRQAARAILSAPNNQKFLLYLADLPSSEGLWTNANGSRIKYLQEVRDNLSTVGLLDRIVAVEPGEEMVERALAGQFSSWRMLEGATKQQIEKRITNSINNTLPNIETVFPGIPTLHVANDYPVGRPVPKTTWLGVDPYLYPTSTNCDTTMRKEFNTKVRMPIKRALSNGRNVVVVFGCFTYPGGIMPSVCHLRWMWNEVKNNRRIIGIQWFLWNSNYGGVRNYQNQVQFIMSTWDGGLNATG
jgi:hypothetical protein